MKQFEEFGKVMAVLLGLKRDGRFAELEELIRNTTLKYTGAEIAYMASVENDQLIETLTIQHKLSDERLKMAGDLLYEQAEAHLHVGRSAEARKCYQKSLLIYEFLQSQSTMPYSLDVHYKVKLLKEMLTS